MTLWLGVALAYVSLLCLGVLLGHALAGRFRRDGGGGRGPEPMPGPAPRPIFGVDWEPLGTAFDRNLLPGVAFDDAFAASRA